MTRVRDESPDDGDMRGAQDAPATEHGGDVTGAERPGRPMRALASTVRARSSSFRCTLAAVAAWAITVAPLAATGRSSLGVRALAMLALLPGLAGPQLIVRDHRIARHVGVTGFLLATVAAWGLATKDQLLSTVDPFRALLGVLAWGVYAVAWSHPWSVPDVDLKLAPVGDTSGLKPRRRMPAAAVGVAGGGVVGALACLALAWSITEPDRAVLGHAAAVGCAIALITSSASLAVIAGRDRGKSSRTRLPLDKRVLNTLLAMLLLLVLGLAIHFVR